ncbi:MAG: hypothetical protein HYY52_08010 [Candidatus Melainabacteria bacterium]|nr:hypothetical protein [Candidatus Melainabacteria bacterium]
MLIRKYVFLKFKYLITLIVFECICTTIAYAIIPQNYQAIVLGKIIKKEFKELNGYYVTEYKLKIKKYLFKKNELPKSKYITLKVLGGELPKKGLIIRSSVSPQFIPIKKEAIFLLENTKKKEKNTFTLSKDGIKEL